MSQFAAALFFLLAAALGIGAIWAMLTANGAAILSALAGDGAFPARAAPDLGPGSRVILLRRPALRAARPEAPPLLSRAA